jgi:hypothetical protein
VPHGPLFRLSFGALLDRRNRYVIEQHTLHYTPALSMLEMTGRLRAGRQSMPAAYLLVGNPSSMPPSSGQILPPLPGAEREVAAIARELPRPAVTVLTGPGAGERAVREAASGKRIVHFATHGVVIDDDPLESFLALGAAIEGRGGRRPPERARDLSPDARRRPRRPQCVPNGPGRTVGRRHRRPDPRVLLRRHAVARRHPVGRRRWPAGTLLPDFYRSMHRLDKAAALRDAQLRLLRDLRAGPVLIDTPGGPVALPERPGVLGELRADGRAVGRASRTRQ